MADPKHTVETITAWKTWSPKLFSFRTTRSPGFAFVPGQFARLGLSCPDPKAKDGSGRSNVWRAYSMVSAADAALLEFYSIVVPEGQFSPVLATCKPGDTLLIDTTVYGFLTTDRFVNGRDLWLISTGTGLAPYLSILADAAIWRQYENIVVVHSVRATSELAYRDEILALPAQQHATGGLARLIYLPVITGGSAPAGALDARVTTLLDDGRLEAAALPLDLTRSRIMLCGNPDMVISLRRQLGARGFSTSRRHAPGQLAVENYW